MKKKTEAVVYPDDENVTEKIHTFLRELHTPGTDLHDLRRSRWFVYERFCERLLGYGFPVKEEEFYDFLKKYAKGSDKDRIVSQFVSSQYNQPKRKTELKIPAKGMKHVRGEDYKDFKYFYDLYHESLHDEYGEKRLYFLIAEKSYLLDRFESEKVTDITYLEKYFNSEKPYQKKLLQKLNEIVINHIGLFKIALEYHAGILLNNATDDVKRWFVDMFHERSIRYLPDWEKYQRKSKNEPSYSKSWQIFEKFINGTPSAKLGYTNATFHNFTHRVKPQGIILLLFWLYVPIYSVRDGEVIQLKKAKENREKILKAVSENLTDEALADVFPPHFYYRKNPYKKPSF